MYRCNSCTKDFEQFQILSDSHGLKHGAEQFQVCPHCQETGYISLKQCSECNEWFDPKTALTGYCKACVMNIAKDITQYFASHFTKSQLDIVEEMLEDADTVQVILGRGA